VDAQGVRWAVPLQFARGADEVVLRMEARGTGAPTTIQPSPWKFSAEQGAHVAQWHGRGDALPAQALWRLPQVRQPDVVTGLHLGWVSLATVANTSAWLTAEGLRVPAPSVWGVLVILVVAVIGMAVGYFSDGRFAPALAIAWGLSWLAYGRLTGEPQSTPIAVAAIVAAVAVLAVPLVIRGRKPARKPEAYARVP
jgi:hypothetical protein